MRHVTPLTCPAWSSKGCVCPEQDAFINERRSGTDRRAQLAEVATKLASSDPAGHQQAIADGEHDRIARLEEALAHLIGFATEIMEDEDSDDNAGCAIVMGVREAELCGLPLCKRGGCAYLKIKDGCEALGKPLPFGPDGTKT